jgi:hypothetical protein
MPAPSRRAHRRRAISALDRRAAHAAAHNGAVHALGSDALPNASTQYFLFFGGADRTRDRRRRLSNAARQEHAYVETLSSSRSTHGSSTGAYA